MLPRTDYQQKLTKRKFPTTGLFPMSQNCRNQHHQNTADNITGTEDG